MNLTQDIPKLYTAFAEWLSCAVVILAQLNYSSKVNRKKTAAVMAVGLILLCGIQYLCGLTEIFNIRAMADLAGVIMIELLHTEILSSGRRREEDAIRNVLHTQYQQYRQSQENMDLINRKYHDLKHQLQVIRAENDSGKRLAYLDEMEDELRFFEAENHTGNTVLDTILTDKSRICVRQRIQMKVVADGKILNHLHVMDLATIFGNALDNAIEHEAQIEDPEKRMIRVSVTQKGMMACATIENYFEGELKKDGGEIKTTKSDENYHGYGLKSIRYAVEKYHGIFSAGVEDGWFKIRIMLSAKGI